MEEEYIAQHRRGNGVLYGAGADHIWLGRNMRKTENEKLRQDTITVSCQTVDKALLLQGFAIVGTAFLI